MSELDVDCVVPTHGRPQFLREALLSIAAQTRPPVQLSVVSDDHDTRSRAVVDDVRPAFTATDVRFVERGLGAPGASASRNLGAATGTARLVAFLDDDDVWAPDYLERAVTRLRTAGVDATVTGTQKFTAAGPTTSKVPLADLDARGVFRRNPGVTGSNIVLRRAAFDTTGGFDPSMRVQNDRDFFLRFVAGGGTYVVEPALLVGVRQHGEGRLTDASRQRADGILAFDAKHGSGYSWWDRRTIRYTSHYTAMSAASTRSAFARSALKTAVNWSPTVARDLPLNLLEPARVVKLVKEIVTGAW